VQRAEPSSAGSVLGPHAAAGFLLVQTDDHSETEVDSLLGVSYLRPGDAWEVSVVA
jgi:hypothetical protein